MKLRSDEPLQSGFRRLVRQQIEVALDECAANRPIEVAVHELRRTFKRIRSLLRLGRYAMGKSAYRRENVAFRDAGRRLSTLRDAMVLKSSFDLIVAADEVCIEKSLVEEMRRLLAENERRVRSQLAAEDGPVAATKEVLTQALARSDQWTAVVVRKRDVIRAVKSTYKRGRRALAAVAKRGTDERLHEWRKQVKYLRHELETLAPVSPAYLKPLAKRAAKLGETLGSDHDLALLQAYSRQAKLSKENSRRREGLIAAVEVLRLPIEAEAIALGEALFAQRSSQFARSLRKVWKGPSNRNSAACQDPVD